MSELCKALLIVAMLSFATTCYADFEEIGEGGAGAVGGGFGGGIGGGGVGSGVGGGIGGGFGDGNIEEGRFLGLLKKGKGRVETYTNYVPYPYPVPVAVPVYQNYGHKGKLGLGKGFISDNGLGQGFGHQGYYPGYPYQYSNIGPVGYGGFGPGFGPGYGYFK